MRLYDEDGLRKLGKALKKMPVSDWKHIAAFHKIVLNYLRMKKLTESK